MLTRRRTLLLLVGCLLLAVAAPAAAAAKRPLRLGFGDPVFQSAEQDQWLSRATGAGAETVKLFVTWRSVAAGQPSSPRDPSDPSYSFAKLDAAVAAADERGLDVLLGVQGAPSWAEGQGKPKAAADGTWKPDPGAVRDFMAALAHRYSGSYAGLPRVRDYQLWNEANLSNYLSPQWKGRRPVAALHYKKMLNAGWKGIKSESPRNRLVVSGLAPYGDGPGGDRTRPLKFWRTVLCLKGRKRLKKAKHCGAKARFDVFAHHAINTSGAPTRSAVHPDDASSGDLPAVRKTLRAAEHAGTTGGKHRHPLWITEFWWESKPPAKSGLSLAKQARYTAETLYLAWRAGFSEAIELRIRDASEASSSPGVRTGDGLYFANGRAKPSLRAFRFPFVADHKRKRKVALWGKAPKAGGVVIERKAGKKWKRVKRLKAGRNHIFSGKARLKGKGKLRARAGRDKSLVWNLK